MSKFCKDCVHFLNGTLLDSLSCCHPDLLGEPDPVFGRRPAPHPKHERSDRGSCGPDARLFKQRPELPEGAYFVAPW